MSSNLVFVDRRTGQDRRYSTSADSNNPDLAPRRREIRERRDVSRSLIDDYHAYMRRQLSKVDYVEPRAARKKAKQ